MSLCFSNEQVVSFWGGRSPVWICRWPWLQEALLNQQDCRARALRPSCVVRWQPVLIGTWLIVVLVAGKHWTAKGVSGYRGFCCSQLEVPRQTGSTGWTRRQELYTRKCLGVSTGFVSSPLEGEHLFTSLHICIDRMTGLCVFFSRIRALLQKHPVVKSKKKIPFFLPANQLLYRGSHLIPFIP